MRPRFDRLRQLLVILILSLSVISPGIANAYILKGTVTDAADGSPLAEATVRLLNGRDSAFVKGVAADIDGKFTIQGVGNGRYLLEATYIGYAKSFVNVRVRNANPAPVDIKMSESSIVLAEATVVGVKTPVKVMEDTVEYNADSYTTQPNAVVEDLLKRLPGVEVDSDGGITANGKSVSKILIDGKEFFSDDPKVASKNLPVDMVEKVQVVDRKSDLARLTGVDDGEDETVINLTVKKNMTNGWFGTVLGGYGTDSRYTVNFNINRFWNGNQLTFLGNANNINELGFTDSNGNRFRRFGGDNGINNSQAFGINFNVGNQEIFRVGGNVMYSHSDRYTWKLQSREYLLDLDSYFQNSTSNADDIGHNLRADFRMQWKPDSFNTVDFRPNFSYNQNESTIDEFSVTQGKNMSQNISHSPGKSYEFGGRLIYTHNFRNVRGRSFSVFGNYNFSNVRENDYSYSYYRYLYNLSTDDEDSSDNDWEAYEQFTDSRTWSNSIAGRLSWTEPLGDPAKGNFLTVAYRASMRWNNADKHVSQLDADAMDPQDPFRYTLSDGIYDVPRPLYPDGAEPVTMADLSSEYRYKYFNQDIRVGYKRVTKFYNLDIGLSLVPQMSSSMELTGSKLSIPERWVWNFAPYMRARIKWSGQRSLHLFYRGNSSQPSMAQLQPVPDTSDPLNIVVGNPDLDPSFTHNLMLRFQDFNVENQRSIMLMANLSLTQNSIVSRTDYDLTTGARTTTYQNVNGVWSARLMNMFSMPFGNKAWTFSNNLFLNFNQRVGFIATQTGNGGLASRNRSQSLMFNEAFTIAYRPQNLELSLRPHWQVQRTWNTVTTNAQSQLTHNYGALFNATYNAPFGLVLSTDVDWTQTTGYANGYDTKQWMWNAQIAYEFLHGRSATVALKVYDILQQKNNVQRTVTANYIDDTMYNSLTRYFMLTFTYRFNTFGSGNQTAGRERGPGRRGPGGPPPGPM